LVLALVACGANGDQVLGTILLQDNPIQVDASALDSAGACPMFNSYPVRDVGSDLDVFFVIDRSQSMLDSMWNKWDVFVSGFTHFLRSGAVDGIGIGVVYYPAMTNLDCRSCFPRDCICFANCGCFCNMRMDPQVCSRGNICDTSFYDRVDVDI